MQGSFPVGTPAGNGVPKVVLTVGTAFKPALGELYKKHPVCTKFAYFRLKIEIFPQTPLQWGEDTRSPHLIPQRFRRLDPRAYGTSSPSFANSGALTVCFPHFVGNDPCLCVRV